MTKYLGLDIVALNIFKYFENIWYLGRHCQSNRRFHFKPAYYSTLPEDTVGYTIQVEALYSFTRLLTIGFPPIRPTIVNRKTGEHLNTNLGAIREVYEIYRNWFAQNAKMTLNPYRFRLRELHTHGLVRTK